MNVIFIHGPPASGKYTIGAELSRLLAVPLFHNHLAVDTALSLFDFGSQAFRDLRAAIWRSSFATAAQAGRSFIFTFNPEATVAPALIDELVAIVEARAGAVLFIELQCSTATTLARLDNENRTRFGKLTDKALYEDIEQQGGFEFPDLPAALVTINTEQVDPGGAAQMIHQAIVRQG